MGGSLIVVEGRAGWARSWVLIYIYLLQQLFKFTVDSNNLKEPNGSLPRISINQVIRNSIICFSIQFLFYNTIIEAHTLALTWISHFTDNDNILYFGKRLIFLLT